MDWWTHVRDAGAVFVDRHGLAAAAVALLIEEAGIPLPFAPGDVIMLLLGVRARQGVYSLWQVIAVLEAVTLVGASLLYWLARRMGRSLLHRYGGVLHLTPARLATAERWLQRHGALAVVLARIVPGFRIAAAVGCGVLGVPFRVFFPGMAVGALISILLFVLLGYALGPPALELAERLHVPLRPAGALLVLALVGVWTARARRALRRETMAPAEAVRPATAARRLRAGAAAGAVATLASSLAVYVLLEVVGAVAPPSRTPAAAPLSPATIAAAARRLPIALARRGDPLLLLVAVPAFVAVGVVWGAAYGRGLEDHLGGPRLPDWAKGIAFAPLPLAAGLVVILPLAGLAGPGAGVRALVLAGAAVRHLLYVIVLALTFPVFLARHLGGDESGNASSSA